MTFNVINLTSLTFNVVRLKVLIAISDDEYCLERDVTWRDVQIFNQISVFKEINKEFYKLVACQMLYD